MPGGSDLGAPPRRNPSFDPFQHDGNISHGGRRHADVDDYLPARRGKRSHHR
jgi:hypothetical protein